MVSLTVSNSPMRGAACALANKKGLTFLYLSDLLFLFYNYGLLGFLMLEKQEGFVICRLCSDPLVEYERAIGICTWCLTKASVKSVMVGSVRYGKSVPFIKDPAD